MLFKNSLSWSTIVIRSPARDICASLCKELAFCNQVLAKVINNACSDLFKEYCECFQLTCLLYWYLLNTLSLVTLHNIVLTVNVFIICESWWLSKLWIIITTDTAIPCKPGFSLLLPYHMLFQTFLMSPKEICVAGCLHVLYMKLSNVMSRQSTGRNILIDKNPLDDRIAQKWYHECYQLLTPKYPMWYYLF